MVFAQLQGSPVNTAGWNLAGATTIVNDEVVLTPVTPSGGSGTSGAIFFGQQVNLTQCQKWKVEFDFRIFDGSGADGIAFCFIDAPPSGFVVGGGVGIPGSANGLKVVFDTFINNSVGVPASPQIQIRYGVGYDQFAAPFNTQPSTATGQTYLRSNAYQTARIEYDNGNIDVYVNNILRLSGFYVVNFSGYMGFTASTGGEDDRHSIKNATIYADIAPSNAGANVSYCHGSSVQIGTTPNPNYTYSWSPTVGLSASNVANPTVTLSNVGSTPINFTYTVTTTLTGASTTCATQDQVVVTVNPIPTSSFTVNKTSVCPGEPVTVTYTGNMTAGAGYAWDFDGGTVISGSGQGPYQVSWPTDGPKQLTLTVTQAGCFSTVTTKNVTVNPAPVITITAPADICLGDTATLTGVSSVGGSTFTWNPGNVTANPILVSPTVTTAYTVSAESPNGCVSEDTTFTVIVKPIPVALITGDTLICNGDSTLLTGSSSLVNSTFLWLPDGETTAQIWANPTQNQTFGLIATKDGCSSDTATFLLKVDSVPTLTVPDSLQICIGEEIVVTVSSTTPGTLFNWNPGDLSGSVNTLMPSVSTEYAVYAYNENCTSETKTFQIEVLQNCDCKLVIPNIFTPNGDQVNDEFFVQNLQVCDISDYEFMLYNRWGDLVWRSTDVTDLWNGKCLMGNCSDGTFFYVLAYSYIPGGTQTPKSVTEKGTVTLTK